MKTFCRFLSFLMVGLLAFPATALAATPSDAERSPEIVKSLKEINIMDYVLDSVEDSVDQQSDNGIMPTAVYIDNQDIANTIDYRGCFMTLFNDGSTKSLSKALDSSGYASLSRQDAETIGLLPHRVSLVIPRSSLPAPGKYQMRVYFGSNTDIEYRTAAVYSLKRFENAARLSNAKTYELGSGAFSVLSGDISFSIPIEIGSNIDRIETYFYFKNDTYSDLPIGGSWKVYFSTPQSADYNTDFTTAGGPSTPEDTQDNIASGIDNLGNIASGISDKVGSVVENTANMVSAQNQTNGLIIQVIQHISDQLFAFWNQLAGAMTDLTNKIIDELYNNFSDQMENDDANTDRLIDNANDNRDHMENGYDKSKLDQENDRLAGVLDDYNSLEDDLLKDTKDNLNNFEFSNPFTQFNVVMADISSILSGIYTSLGTFNIPIGFSFTLTIAMLCIGWYRFKGGA